MKPESISNPDRQAEILRKLKTIRFYSTKICSYIVYGVNSVIVAVILGTTIGLSKPSDIVSNSMPLYGSAITYVFSIEFLTSTVILLSYLPR